jgi:hypothetical protein
MCDVTLDEHYSLNIEQILGVHTLIGAIKLRSKFECQSIALAPLFWTGYNEVGSSCC